MVPVSADECSEPHDVNTQFNFIITISQVQYSVLVYALLSPRLILNMMFICLLLFAVSGAVRCEGGNVCVSGIECVCALAQCCAGWALCV